jgi:hypothetical protein
MVLANPTYRCTRTVSLMTYYALDITPPSQQVALKPHSCLITMHARGGMLALGFYMEDCQINLVCV